MNLLLQRSWFFWLMGAIALALPTETSGQGTATTVPVSTNAIDSALLKDSAHVEIDTLTRPCPPNVGWPSAQLPDSIANLRHFKTKGKIEVGGIQGPLPYTAAGNSLWNGYAKGEVGADLFGVPVKMMLDLGTDLPIRGQRNSVRFSFDSPRLLEKDKWGNAEALHVLNSRLDSLQALRDAQFRKVKGAETRLAAWRPPETNLPKPQVDTTGLPNPVHQLGNMSMHQPDSPPIPAASTGKGQLDSLRKAALAANNRMDQLDELVTEQRMRVQRLASTMNAAKAEPGVIGNFSQGIKHLELGSCSPGSSEFLINGINFQGVSFEYERKGIYLSLDKGRSFDDTWMDTDPVRGRLRTLQQSLFFADAQDLNPRKLTAVKVGLGSPEATHFHMGYLTGSRDDIPMGLALPPGPSFTLRNHVVELDLGYAIKKNHLLRVTWARSVTGGSSNAETGSSSPQVGDLFVMNAGMDQAVKLGWSSNFERTGTRFDVGVHSISPYFQSFGMGFIRNGSRAVEMHLDQRMGKALRIRGRYALEERTVPGEGPQRSMDIQRAQVMLMYRPTRSLNIRTTLMPVRVRANGVEGVQARSENTMYSLGGDLRHRWRKTVALFSAELSLYEWKTTQSMNGMVANRSISLSILQGDRWNMRASWTGMAGLADSSMVPVDNISFHMGYLARKGTVVDAGAQVPTVGNVSWVAEVRQPVSKRINVGLRGESFSRTDLFYSPEVWSDQNNRYNWALLTTIVW